MLVLEERSRALNRGAPICGEILGYGANCDARGMLLPSAKSQADCLQKTLNDAGTSCFRRRKLYLVVLFPQPLHLLIDQKATPSGAQTSCQSVCM